MRLDSLKKKCKPKKDKDSKKCRKVNENKFY